MKSDDIAFGAQKFNDSTTTADISDILLQFWDIYVLLRDTLAFVFMSNVLIHSVNIV